MSELDFLATLPIERRLALSYAPARSRGLWLGLFALDARLSGIVRDAREPMLAQIKLAWWREELAKPLAARRRGEPLLELLAAWGDEAAGLAALIDGWEILQSDEMLGGDDLAAVLNARAIACRALADRLVIGAEGIEQAARGWAAADFAPMSAGPIVRDWPRIALPREMRPLQVLYGLAARRSGQTPLIPGPIAAMAAVRLGLFGI
jgi:15-cis-phytoene synthase